MSDYQLNWKDPRKMTPDELAADYYAHINDLRITEYKRIEMPVRVIESEITDDCYHAKCNRNK